MASDLLTSCLLTLSGDTLVFLNCFLSVLLFFYLFALGPGALLAYVSQAYVLLVTLDFGILLGYLVLLLLVFLCNSSTNLCSLCLT